MCDLRGYSYSTKKGYKNYLKGLFFFYKNVKPNEISEIELSEYLNYLVVHKKYARGSVLNALGAINFYYKTVLREDVNVKIKYLPPPNNNSPDYLTQEEVLLLIDSIENLKHKTILALLYGTGMKIHELLNIRLLDIKRNKNEIHIKGKDNSIARKCYISSKLLSLIDKYYRSLEKRTVTFLFEGTTPGKQYSIRSLQNFFNKYTEKQGLSSKLTPTILRHCYIKHMVQLNVPLVDILQDLMINSFRSSIDYTRKIYGQKSMRFTPLERTIFENKYDAQKQLKLEALVEAIESHEEKAYLLEGLACLRVNAYRAAVLQIWNAAMMKLRGIALTIPLRELNKELLTIYPKAKRIKKIEDFEFVKDDFLILLTLRLGILSKSERDVLTNNCLSLRNKCGHPVSYSPELYTIEAFIQEVIQIVYKKRN